MRWACFLLARVLVSRQSYRGGEIKHPMGPVRGRIPEAHAINPSLWQWRTVLSCKWKHPEHINVLEARALGLLFRWRARSAKHIQVMIENVS